MGLAVCSQCKAINASFVKLCHNCGSPMATQVGIASATEHPGRSAIAQGQDLSDLDKAVLSAIEVHDGTISLSDVTTLLGVSPETLAQSIERLENSHLIEKQVSGKKTGNSNYTKS